MQVSKESYFYATNYFPNSFITYAQKNFFSYFFVSRLI
jgi:hypothetical protein